MRIGEDVFAIKALPGNINARYKSEHLLNAKGGYGSDHVVRGLAKCAIGMGCAVGVNVRRLYRGAKKKEER